MTKRDKNREDRFGTFSLDRIAYDEGDWISDFNDRNALLKTAFFNSLCMYIDLSVSFRGDISSTKEAKLIQEMVLAGSLDSLKGVVDYYRSRGNYDLEKSTQEVEEEPPSAYEEVFEEIFFEELEDEED